MQLANGRRAQTRYDVATTISAPSCVPTYTWPSADIAGVTKRVVEPPTETFAFTAPVAGSSANNAPPLPTLSTTPPPTIGRSEEHTSELQSRFDLVCRLLLEK